MTLVVDPGADVDDAPGRARPTRRRSPLGRWRFAARLAQREVRRRPGRSALVAALIAVPVTGMGVASVVAATNVDSDEEEFARTAGAADIVVNTWGATVSDDTLREALPDGSTWLRSIHTWAPLRTPAGDHEQAILTNLDLSSPLADRVVDVTSGAAPGDGEILLSADLADDLGVRVGDRLELARPEGAWNVSGLGRKRDAHNDPLVVMPDFDATQLRRESRLDVIRIGLPGGAPATEVDAAGKALAGSFPPGTLSVQTASGDLGLESGFMDHDPDRVPPTALAWGWVAGTVALGAVGVIVTAAFATSARRQLATIGQLSANGSPSWLIRRTLALQGSWSGLVGGAIGLAATAAVVVVGRPLMERIAGRDVGPTVVSPVQLGVILATAVVVATLAALVPARTAVRIPVLAALAGRRPLRAVPRRLVPVGVTLFVGGLGLLAASAAAANGGAGGNLVAAVAVVGGLAVLAGMCCTTPLVVDLLRGVPARGSWRLAIRGLVRQRTRSAAVVTAIATVGAISIAGATVAARIADEERNRIDHVPTLPRDAVVVRTEASVAGAGDSFRVEVPPVPDSVRDALARIVPGSPFSTVRAAVPVPPVGISLDDVHELGSFVVADPAVLDLIGLAPIDANALQRVGALSMWSEGEALTLRPGDRAIPVAGLSAPPASRGGFVDQLVTPERAAELGWVVFASGLIVRSDSALTDEQQSAINELNDFNGDSPWVADRSRAPAGSYWLTYESASFEVPPALVELAIVAAALLLTLVVVAIGLALAASEGRDERDVLLAVGARPATTRRLAASRAVVLTTVAAALAVPTGYFPIVAVYRATDGDVTGFPWISAAALLVAVPLVAGAVAWLVSAVAQRVRPVRMSTLTFE